VRGGDAEKGSERRMPGAPAIEAEDEFIEVGLQVRATQAVVDAQGPNFEVGEDPVDPGQDNVSGHLADDMGIMAEAGGAGISGPTIGFGGGAGGEIGGEEGVEAGGRVIGDPAEADAAGAAAAVLDLDGADDQHFALMAASAAAGDRIIFAAAGDFGFIDLDQTGQRAAARREHAAAQFGADQPRRLVGAECELTLQLQRRDAVGVGGHQISGPEPGGQRQLGVVHDGSGSDRSLPTACSALIGPGLGFQPPGFATAAARADKPVRPAGSGKVLSAGGLIAKALLELDQGAWKVGHCGHPGAVMFVICSITNLPSQLQHFVAPDAEG
jgi:hypothetical protein